MARRVACAGASDASRRDAGDVVTSSRSDGKADGAPSPATRRADGDCGPISAALVVNDATASPPPRAADLGAQALSARRAILVQRLPNGLRNETTRRGARRVREALSRGLSGAAARGHPL